MATRRKCQRALELHETDLTRIDKVVGLGVIPTGEKFDRLAGNEMVVAVYVIKEPMSTNRKLKGLIPKKLAIPSRKGVVQVPTRVVVTGEIVPETKS